ncbi:hypothetical protein BJ742DRAFT_874989 [Cladochytrium replicatum]|nr:hypothetical protein BJ742DRAFT_874989 [Cladochytrium replicatum]
MDSTTQWIRYTFFCAVVVTAALFYFFYSPRIAAYIFSRVATLYTWQKWSIWIELGSVGFSPLSGKVFFKDFRIHTQNYSIRVLQGHFVLRYWVSRVRGEELTSKGFPTRLKLRLDGLEIFIYNRANNYETISKILREMGNAEESVVVNNSDQRSSQSWIRFLLPLEIRSGIGSVRLYNPDVKSMLTLSFRSASGFYEWDKPANPLDIVTTSLNLKLTDVNGSMQNNPDYHDVAIDRLPQYHSIWSNIMQRFRKSERSTQGGDDDSSQWFGLGRYTTISAPSLNAQSGQEEYAIVEKILECGDLEISFEFDTPGDIVENIGVIEESDNSDPRYSLLLRLHNASVSYGPWAERQRGLIQSFFYPPLFQDLKITPPHVVGQQRLAKNFIIVAEFVGKTVWRVPAREFSKDAQFYVLSSDFDVHPSNIKERSYGWIDLSFKSESRLEICVPLIVSKSGSDSSINVILKSVSANTSVHYAEFLSADFVSVSCKFHSPVKWNSARTNSISVVIEKAKAFALRDHITLIQDVLKDFSSGPVVPFEKFVPTTYNVELELRNYQVNLCVNPGNIIDQPNDKNENSFFTLYGPTVSVKICLPFVSFNPPNQNVQFSVVINKAKLLTQFAKVNTIGTFLSPADIECADVSNLSIFGDFTYARASEPKKDLLVLRIEAESLFIKLFGFFIRYVLYLRENYLGENVNFITSEEVQKFTKKSRKDIPKNPTNALDVQLEAEVKDAIVCLPENLFNSSSALVLYCQSASLELIAAPSYTDITVSVCPFQITYANPCTPEIKKKLFLDTAESSLHINGLQIHGHRLMGPAPRFLLFGTHWDFCVGGLIGEMQPMFISVITNTLSSFLFHFRDIDNRLQIPQSYGEIFSLFLQVGSVNLKISFDDCILGISLDEGITFATDNIIEDKILSRNILKLKTLNIEGYLVSESSSQNRQSFSELYECFSVQLSADINGFSRGDLGKQEQYDLLDEVDPDRDRLHQLFAKYEYLAQKSAKLSKPFEHGNSLSTFRAPLSNTTNDGNLENGTNTFLQRQKRVNEEYIVPKPHEESEIPEFHEDAEPTKLNEEVFQKFNRNIPYETQLKKHSVRSESYPLPHLYPLSVLNTVKSVDRKNFASDPLMLSTAYSKRMLSSYLQGVPSDIQSISVVQPSITQHIVIEISNEIKLKVTTMFANFVESWLNSIAEVYSWETLLDKLTRDFTNKILSKNQKQTIPLSLIFSVPQIVIETLQKPHFPDQPSFMKDFFLQIGQENPDSRVSCQLELQIHGVFGYLCKSEHQTRVLVDIDAIDTKLKLLNILVHPVGSDIRSYEYHSSFDVVAEKLSVLLDSHPTDTFTKARLDLLGFTLSPESLEILSGCVFSWLNFSKYIAGELTSFKNRERHNLQKLLHRSLYWAQKEQLFGDPIFLTHPSAIWSLIQRPHQSDFGWKLLCHVRYCLQTLSQKGFNSAIEDFQNTSNQLHQDEMFEQLLKSLKNWNSWNFENWDRCDLLLKIYKPSKDHEAMRTLIIGDAIIKAVTLEIINDEGSSNEISVNNFKIVLRKTNKEASFALYSTSFELHLNPGLLKFGIRIMHIIPWWTKGGKKVKKNHDVSANISVSIAYIAVDISADNLLWKTTIDNLILSKDSNPFDEVISNSISETTMYLSITCRFNSLQSCLLEKSLIAKTDNVAPILELVATNHIVQLTSCESLESSNSQLSKKVFALVDGQEINLSHMKSILKLQDFFIRWSDDFFGRFSTSMGRLQDEFSKTQSLHSSRTISDVPTIINVIISIGSLNVAANILSNLEFSYKVGGLLFSFHQSDGKSKKRIRGKSNVMKSNYSVSILNHQIGFITHNPQYTGSDHVIDVAQSASIPLPNTNIKASILKAGDSRSINASAELGSIETILSTDLVDQLLTAQAILGNEVNDVVESFVFLSKNLKWLPLSTAAKNKDSSYNISVYIQSINLVIESPRMNVVLSSGYLKGKIQTNPSASNPPKNQSNLPKVQWFFFGDQVKLAFIPISASQTLESHIAVDLHLSNRGLGQVEEGGLLTWSADIQKLFAVLYPEHIPLALQTVSYLKAIFDQQSEQRANKLSKLKQNAQRLLNSMQVSVSKYRKPSIKALAKRQILAAIKELKLVIPLSTESVSTDKESRTTLLLLSARSLSFLAKQFTKYLGQVEDFQFQFIPNFIISHLDSNSFLEEYQTKNQLLLKKIDASLTATLSRESKVTFVTFVRGFEVNVDPMLPRFVMELFDMVKFSLQTVSNLVPASSNNSRLVKPQSDGGIMRFECRFESDSATCYIALPTVSDNNTELQRINLPALMLGCRGALDLSKERTQMNQLHTTLLELKISASENTISPGILQFVDSSIETFVKVRSTRKPLNTSKEATKSFTPSEQNATTYLNMFDGISISLQLFETKVTLNTNPYSKVVLSTLVKNIDVFIFIPPNSTSAKASGKVVGVAATLSHIFSPEFCLDTGFPSAHWTASIDFGDNKIVQDLMVDLSNGRLNLNVRHLQDFFLFQRVWFPSSNKSIPVPQLNAAEFLNRKGIAKNILAKLLVNVNSIEMSADIGQIVGKTNANINDAMVIIQTDIQNGQRVSSLNSQMKSCHFKSEGRLNGEMIFDNFAVNISHSIVDGLNPVFQSILLVSIDHVQSHLFSQYEPVLALQVARLYGMLKLVPHGNAHKLKELFQVEDFKTMISRKAVPTLVDNLGKLLITVKEKQKQSKEVNIPGSIYSQRAQSSTLVVTTQNDTSENENVLFVLYGRKVTLAELIVDVKNGAFTLLRSSFKDSDCVHLQLRNSNLAYKYMWQENVSETTDLNLGGVSLRKSVIKQFKGDISVTDLLELLKTGPQSSGKVIVDFPATAACLELHNLQSSEIEYSFVSNFEGQIDIALNIGLYKFLLELKDAYTESYMSLKREKREGGVQTEEPPELLPVAPPEIQEKQSSARSFVCKDFKFDPHLKVTGDATPLQWVNWIGVNKEEVPRWVFRLVTKYQRQIVFLLNQHDKNDTAK